MKKLFLAFAIFAIACAVMPAAAQSYGTVSTVTNYLTWTGTTNTAAIGPSGSPATNVWTMIPASTFIQLTNVVSTNETFTGGVYVQVPVALLTNFPGYSNLLYIGSVSQSFSNGLPAGGIWSTTTVPTAGSVAFPVILQAANGIYTNGIFAK
jgi:hypothetical protein